MLMARSGFPVPWNEGGGFRRGLPLRGDKVPMGSLKNSWPFHGSFFTKTGKPDLSGWTECGRKARKARIKFLSHVALPLGKTVKGQKTPWFGPKTAAWERKFDSPLFFRGNAPKGLISGKILQSRKDIQSFFFSLFPTVPHSSNTGFSTAFFTVMRNCTACLPSTRRWS